MRLKKYLAMLLIAVVVGMNWHSVRVLADTNINTKDVFEMTPLHVAVRQREMDVELIKMLVENGADVNAKDCEGYTPLGYVLSRTYCLVEDGWRSVNWEKTWKEKFEITKLMLRKGAHIDVNIKSEWGGRVHSFCYIEEMKRFGCNVNEIFEIVINSEESVSLDFAHSVVKYGNESVIRSMLKKNIEADIGCLGIAVRTGDKDKVKLLLEHGVSVNATDAQGRTALHIAASHRDKDMVEFLLSVGANKSIKDCEGRTPLHVASAERNRDIVEMLLKHDKGIE